jgi:hypothetical protein
MNEQELNELLHQSSSAFPGRSAQPRDLVGAVIRRLRPRERWQDVCLLLGSATVIAFCLALAVACRFGSIPGSAPALRLFQEQPASHPFAIP